VVTDDASPPIVWKFRASKFATMFSSPKHPFAFSPIVARASRVVCRGNVAYPFKLYLSA
jgi:hypothetical protein